MDKERGKSNVSRNCLDIYGVVALTTRIRSLREHDSVPCAVEFCPIASDLYISRCSTCRVASATFNQTMQHNSNVPWALSVVYD